MRILIVDECRITGSQSEALMALFVERTPGAYAMRPVERGNEVDGDVEMT